MFRHVVMFRWHPGTTDAQVEAAIAALRAMVPKIPTLRSFEIARDAGASEGTFDLCVIAQFDDADGYRAYAAHEAHVSTVAEHIKPHLAERAALQGSFS